MAESATEHDKSPPGKDLYTRNLPKYVEALVDNILNRIALVYRNLDQLGRLPSDHDIPGIDIRNDDEAEDLEDMLKPNLGFGGVEIWWYPYPITSMSSNRELTLEEWVKWFDDCIGVIEEYEASINRAWWSDRALPFPSGS